jgi:hypothetical protein
MRTHTTTIPRPAVLLSLLALGALGLLVGGGGGQSAAASPAATGSQAITTVETTITQAPRRPVDSRSPPTSRARPSSVPSTPSDRVTSITNHSTRAHHPSG